MTFIEILDATKKLLERRKRLTYGALKREFDLDDGYLEDLKTEIIQGQRFAREEGGVLVWTGSSETTPVLFKEHGEILSSKRQLTVMFCDVVNFTRLSQTLDTEDQKKVVDEYHNHCAQAVSRFGGMIAQNLGDGVMAYFGHPVAHEDNALRGVYAALKILEELPNLNNSLKQFGVDDLRLRIGIDTGKVVVGKVGTGDSQKILAIGETPNVAARIQDRTEPNTVVISEETHSLVNGYFETSEPEPHELKGISRSINLRRVIGKSGVKSRLEALGSRLTPLVGRDGEIELLLNRWARVKDGMGQVVMISGDPGIGKSRLVDELKQRLKREKHSLQEYRCSPFYQNTALYPIVNLLEQKLHLGEEDTDDAKLRRLKDALKKYGFNEEAVALLAKLLSVPIDTPLKFTPETQMQETLKVLVALLLETSPSRPLLLIVEDLHWIDPTTLAWLTMVVNQSPKARVLVVLTFRTKEPDRNRKEYAFNPPWEARPNLDAIPLQGLTNKQVIAMAQGVVEGKTLPTEVNKHLINNTDGVPLFVEELTKSLMESGVLQPLEKGYELSGTLSEEIPSTLQDLLMARLDRLSTAKQVAQLGATLGREFSFELLEAVSTVKGTTLRNELTRLEDAGLLFKQGLSPQATYIFKHALIEKAAYESLLKDSRREFHQQIAEVLKDQFSSTAESEPELLAYHYTHAGLPKWAIPKWKEAGDRALIRSANSEAIGHLTQGLDLLEGLPESPERDKMELAMQLGLGQAYSITKGWGSEEVTKACQRAIPLAQKLLDQAVRAQKSEDVTSHGQSLYAATWFLCFNYFLRGQMNDSLKKGKEVLQMAKATDNSLLWVGAHHAIGYSYHYQGQFTEAQKHAEQGISRFNLKQERIIIQMFQLSSTVALHEFCGSSKWMLGEPVSGLAEIEKAVALAEELGHPPSIAFAYGIGCFAYHSARNFEWVENASAKVLELAEKEVFQLWDTIALIYHGWAIAKKGRIEEGIDEIERGLEKFRPTGTKICLPDMMTMRGEVLWMAGRTQDALDALDEGIREATDPDRNEHFMEPELYRLKAEILKQRAEAEARTENAAPDFTKAEDYFKRALSTASNQKALMLGIRAAVGLVRLSKLQRKQQEALQILEKLYNSLKKEVKQEAQKLYHSLKKEVKQEVREEKGKKMVDLVDALALIEELRESP